MPHFKLKLSRLFLLLLFIASMVWTTIPSNVFAADDYKMTFSGKWLNKGTIEIQTLSFSEIANNTIISPEAKEYTLSQIQSYINAQAKGKYVDADIGDGTQEYVLENDGCNSKIKWQEGHWKLLAISVNITGKGCINVLRDSKDPVLPYKRYDDVQDEGVDTGVNGFLNAANIDVWFFRVDEKKVKRYDGKFGIFEESDTNQPGFYFSKENSKHRVDISDEPSSVSDPYIYFGKYYEDSPVETTVYVYDEFGEQYDEDLNEIYMQRAREVRDQLKTLKDETIFKCYIPIMSEAEITLMEQQGSTLREMFESTIALWTQTGSILDDLVRLQSLDGMSDSVKGLFACIQREEPEVSANILRIIVGELPEPVAVETEGEGDEADVDANCKIAGGALTWILCPVYDLVEEAFQTFGEWVVSLLSYSMSSGDFAAQVKPAWEAIRNVANVLFVIAFLVIIISQTLGGKL